MGKKAPASLLRHSSPRLIFVLASLCSLVVFVGDSLSSPRVSQSPTQDATAGADFNRDGFDDLAIGVPFADDFVQPAEDSGAVNVLFGSSSRLVGDDGQRELRGRDRSGFSLATGDFNGDGFSDLAVGTPYRDIQGAPGQDPPRKQEGSVRILFGSTSGLRGDPDQQFLDQRLIGTAEPESFDRFGFALAAGDFDNDGFDELAVGVTGEDNVRGEVDVFSGSTSGLEEGTVERWTQDSDGIVGRREEGDTFGFALVAANFDDDPYDDLAIGVPFEDLEDVRGEGDLSDVGAVNVMYGSGGGLQPSGNQQWHQNSRAMVGLAESRDKLGFALIAGDFDGNGSADLAIGVPAEDLELASGRISDAGAVNVLYGSAGPGLSGSGDEQWHQDLSEGAIAIVGKAEPGDRFGMTLAAGDMDGNGSDDLTVGVPREDFEGVQGVGTIEDGGAVHVLYGSRTRRLSAIGNQQWHQNSRDIFGAVQEDDQFGSALAMGDFRNDGGADLAVGVPFEDYEVRGLLNAGGVNVIYGARPGGLASSRNHFWHRDLRGVAGDRQPRDLFGLSLAPGTGTAHMIEP